MPEHILVVNTEGSETRVGVLEDGVFSEYFVERKRERGIVGNIYKGKVSRVLPGMQAAFIDLGPTVERKAYLHVGDVRGAGDERRLFDGYDSGEGDEEGGRARSKRRPATPGRIEQLLKENQDILVQIVKEPVGAKGARVTGYISLPGRHCVFMPTIDRVGVSRRISSEKERRRLRSLVDAARPRGAGFIVRTAAEGADDQEVRDDVEFLTRLWQQIGQREQSARPPCLLYSELDLVLRSIRDLLRDNVSQIIIDTEEQYERARKFVSAFMPRYLDRIRHHDGRLPIFDHYGIEPELRTALSKRVPLKSGGSLVIEQGEALTAIDVNTGSFVGKDDLEQTLTKNNLEACKEIARQLRLRNIGGIIVIDFVDMDKEANRKKVWEAFNEALKHDRTRANVTKISELGLVEMTRKRTRESLIQQLTEPCPTCLGSGTVKSTATVAFEVLREVRRVGSAVKADTLEVECTPDVGTMLRNDERDYLDYLEKKFQRKIEIRSSDALKHGQYRVAGRSIISAESAEVDSPDARKRRANGRRRSASSRRRRSQPAGASKTSG
jgi:ribonuclease G